MSEVNELLESLQNGTMSLDEVATEIPRTIVATT